jgi:uncharacterized membrane protein
MSDGEKNPKIAPESSPVHESLLGEYGSRKIMLISVALNIFFVAAAGAYLARHYLASEHSGQERLSGQERHWRDRGDHSAGKRIEALARRLSADNAAVLRSEFARRAEGAEEAHQTVHQKKNAVRQALQADPFDAATARSAMSESRAAHQAFMQVIHDVIATAAAAMSPEGRRQLAEFGRGERSGGK